MHKHGCLLLPLGLLLITLLTGCMGAAWTGASMFYDRHNVYKKVSDYRVSMNGNQALFSDKTFKTADCTVDVTVFKNKILLSGHVSSSELRDEAQRRIMAVSENLPVYNQLQIENKQPNTMQDSWITTKIRLAVLADSAIDPNGFKVITSDGIVYLLGEMRKEEAAQLIHIARNTEGVVKVVKILKYFTYLDNSEKTLS